MNKIEYLESHKLDIKANLKSLEENKNEHRNLMGLIEEVRDNCLTLENYTERYVPI